MKKNIITLLTVALCATGFAQSKPGLGIGTKKVNGGAALEISATSKGVLIPRVKLSDSKTWGLEGTATESMLVYNETAAGDMKVGFYYWSKAMGTPAVAGWDLITSQTELTKHLTDVRNEFKTQIDNVTNIGGDDKSYLVAFDPSDKNAAETTGTFTYLVAKKDADGKITGYDKKKITFKDMIAGSETNTFFKEKTVQVKDPNDPTKEIKTLVGYYYFSEKAISDWVSVPGNTVDNIPDANGKLIDITQVVTNNFKEIFNSTDNTKTIENIVENAAGVVRAVSDGNGGMKLVYKLTQKGPDVDFLINSLETKTKFGRLVATGDMNTIAPGDYKPVDVVPVKAKAGEIIYQYYGEDSTKPNFINITSDVVTTINNNTDVKNAFETTVNKYLSQGGNVYYGELEAGKGKVLFEKVLKAGTTDEYVDTPIDISKDILKIIENNKEIIEKIKEVTKVVVEKGKGDLPTGEVINGKTVYKGIATVEVKDVVGYDSTFQGFITAAPKKVEINNNGVAEIKDSTDEFGRLLRVSIIDAAGNVLINSATNVTSPSKNQFNFYFGMGEMYVPLDNATNYEVVYEYIAK